jgi:hypothetical protein
MFNDHLAVGKLSLDNFSFDSEQFQLGEHFRNMIGGPFCIYVHSAFSAC